VLWGLERVEEKMKSDRSGTLLINLQATGPSEKTICDLLRRGGLGITSLQVSYDNEKSQREYCLGLRWRARPTDESSPAFLGELASAAGVRNVQWKPTAGRAI
jgi:hypothetical protein